MEHAQWKAGSKRDAIDARGLAEHLRTGQIKTEVYKAPQRFTKLRELARTYAKLTSSPASSLSGFGRTRACFTAERSAGSGFRKTG